ncbi:phosphocholine-specific phospholipase C [Sphingosinicella sp. BN140058]|uniref:phosphocholine-specific phospholipase C n=1 Tax=Sphingosinicella sp. BN140058 TaxID=1892855 RepID=UPI0010116178|nr:phospholipase C, phosphocholine-specific [Sphingosinicella sp. BN140058]QAY75814.1 phospholipase C, phosphocholine-specific [Sphingosinicella sp. BN140058]
MTSIPRRTLLKGGLGAAALAALPPSIARALAIPADVRTGTIRDVDHVVILMQENRSFDHYFGTLRGVRGFADPHPIPLPGDARTIWEQAAGTGPGARRVAPFHLATASDWALMRMEGTPHSWPDAQRAWDQGRMADWPAHKTERAMGHYRREDLPFQFALADAFTICDAYHCSAQTGTNTNRLFLWTGTNDPAGRHGGPAIANSHDSFPRDGGAAEPYTWTTYPERLQAAGIDWRIYQDMADNFTDNPLVGFAAYRAAQDRAAGADAELRERALTTRGLDRLRADALAGTLPQVSWIIATAAGSEHPGPSSPAQGAAYTAEVLDALTADPTVWGRTALLVMFDENDGFFDHVPPPAPPSRDPDAPGGLAGASTVTTAGDYHDVASAADAKDDLAELRGRPYGLGPRVPCYIVSPWSRGGWVNSEVFDHTSVLRFLERRFGVAEPNISPWRRAVCGDLTSAFDFANPNRGRPAALPDPRPAARRAAAILGQVAPAAPAKAQPLRQEPGTRPARPLPYDLDVGEARAGGTLRLTFHARGATGAVFHVYDRHALERLPRRYTVEGGKQLTGVWESHGPDGGYDLWVLGPNGFHRHFVGDAGDAAIAGSLSWELDRGARQINLKGADPAAFVVSPAARHAAHHAAWPGTSARTPLWSLDATEGWYDLLLTSPAAPRFARRIAGRLETGA